MIHNDHLGTPQKMTDASGAVVWSTDYKPFGEAAVTVSTITNNLRFPGQYFDVETGLHYNYFRDYDTALGRYKQADPIGIVKGKNHLYVYVGNNPINFIDPLGLHKWPYEHEHSKYDHPTENVDAMVYDKFFGLLGKGARFYPHFDTRHEYVQEMINKHEQYHYENGTNDEDGAYKEELKNIAEKLKGLRPDDPGVEELKKLEKEVRKRLGKECPK